MFKFLIKGTATSFSQAINTEVTKMSKLLKSFPYKKCIAGNKNEKIENFTT